MKRTRLLSFIFVGAAILIGSQNLYTTSTQPPAGFTGAPGEATCATVGCHNSSAAQFSADFATLGGAGQNRLSDGMVANTQYTLTVNAGGNSGVPVYGFSITALDATGDSIGNFVLIGSGATTSLLVANGKQYVGHKNANSTVAWTFNWQSPATVEPVFFYLVVNRANGDGGVSGDNVFTATYRADANGIAVVGPSSIQNIDALTDKSIMVFPNPISDRLNLSFNLANGSDVKADIYNLNGQLVKPLIEENLSFGSHDRSYNVAGELSTGIYLVKMTIDGADYFKKIVVE